LLFEQGIAPTLVIVRAGYSGALEGPNKHHLASIEFDLQNQMKAQTSRPKSVIAFASLADIKTISDSLVESESETQSEYYLWIFRGLLV
jgi:hypothetical protein